MKKNNIFHSIPADLPEELIQTLVECDNVRIERILSRGHCSPEGFWYDQDEDEFVFLVQGEAELQLQQPDQRIRLSQGDFLVIHAHQQHRVAWTSSDPECIWLTVFFRPTADPLTWDS